MRRLGLRFIVSWSAYTTSRSSNTYHWYCFRTFHIFCWRWKLNNKLQLLSVVICKKKYVEFKDHKFSTLIVSHLKNTNFTFYKAVCRHFLGQVENTYTVLW